jgi:hypothetical protein
MEAFVKMACYCSIVAILIYDLCSTIPSLPDIKLNCMGRAVILAL